MTDEIKDQTEFNSQDEPLQSKPPGVGTLLRNSNFSKMFFGGLISDIGSFFTFIAIIFLSIRITSGLTFGEQAQAIALITFFFILPTLFIGPFTGAIVDRFDRKKVMYIADLFGSFTSFGLVYVAVYTQEMSHIYLFAVMSTIVRLFFYPARGASIPIVVERKEALVQANGIIQIFSQLSRIIGPALAGIIIATFSIEFAFIIDGISYLLSGLLIFNIKTDLKPQTTGKTSFGQITRDLITGGKMVVSDRVIFFIMIFFMVIIFGIGMIDPLFAIYLSSEFGMNEAEFGYILSISAVTGLISAIILTSKGSIKRKVTFTVSTSFVVGLSVGIIGMAGVLPYNPRMWLYVGMALIGAINVLVAIPSSALLQAIVKNEHLGKMNGFMSTGIALSQVGGAGLASYLATSVSISQIYIYVGLFSLLIGVIGLFLVYAMGIEGEAQQREEQAIKEQNDQNKQNPVPEIEERFISSEPLHEITHESN